jgi:DNA (cytosine-5)-methyltransferase 1
MQNRQSMQMVLSLFSGIGLLDIGFKENGFCVVSAGDTINGSHHDIRKFHTKRKVFNGIIGGSPCQDFSRARRTPPTGEGLELLGEFTRIVKEAEPDWFLLENVPTVPNIEIGGYFIQRFDLNAKNCGSKQNRNRHFQFGSLIRYHAVLDIKRDESPVNVARCVTASEGGQMDRRTFADVCELQGLDRAFDLPSFTQSGKYRAVGNGVNVLVSRRIAEAIKTATHGLAQRREYLVPSPLNVVEFQKMFCACGCGRQIKGRQKSATPNCRKRLEKNRKDKLKMAQNEK